MSTIKTLIVDDERLARKRLRRLLSQFPIIEVVGEADSVNATIHFLNQQSIDCIFLDIQMPESSGFELIGRISELPSIVFVTAYSEFAVDAFEVEATDYVVKPVNKERLRATVERIQRHHQSTQRNSTGTKETAICIESGKKMKMISSSEILFVNSADDYSEVHLKNGKTILSNFTMSHWEAKLRHLNFFRTHRTCLLNLQWLREIQRKKTQRVAHLQQGHELPIGRRRIAGLKEALETYVQAGT